MYPAREMMCREAYTRMVKRLVCLAGLLAIVLTAASRGFAQQSPDDGLDNTLNDMIKAHHGKVGIYARQLNSTHEIAIDADEIGRASCRERV